MLDTLLQLQKAARIHAYALIGEGGDVSYTPGVGTVDRGKCSPIGVPKRNVRYHNLLDVLEHRLQPERLVSEASRVLRRGGLFVLAITNLGDISSRIAFRFGYTPFRTILARAKSIARKIQSHAARSQSVFTYRQQRARGIL